MRKALIKQTAELIRNSDNFDMKSLENCIMGHYVQVRYGKKLRAELDMYLNWYTVRAQIAKDFGFETLEDLRNYPLFQLGLQAEDIKPMSRTKAANALIREFCPN